ncbi:MAG: hypothetical protein ACOCXM_03775, partial [Myxococcota bacterium]
GQALVPGLAARSDIDGDGLSDLFVGSRFDGGDVGVAQLFYGQAPLPATEPRSSAGETFDPPTTSTRNRVPGFIGDIDGDGAPDLGVGDPNDGAGKLVIFY